MTWDAKTEAEAVQNTPCVHAGRLEPVKADRTFQNDCSRCLASALQRARDAERARCAGLVNAAFQTEAVAEDRARKDARWAAMAEHQYAQQVCQRIFDQVSSPVAELAPTPPPTTVGPPSGGGLAPAPPLGVQEGGNSSETGGPPPEPLGTLCALCGQEALGFATVPEGRLCHDESRDCYRRWTVYGERPAAPQPRVEEPERCEAVFAGEPCQKPSGHIGNHVGVDCTWPRRPAPSKGSV